MFLVHTDARGAHWSLPLRSGQPVDVRRGALGIVSEGVSRKPMATVELYTATTVTLRTLKACLVQRHGSARLELIPAGQDTQV